MRRLASATGWDTATMAGRWAIGVVVLMCAFAVGTPAYQFAVGNPFWGCYVPLPKDAVVAVAFRNDTGMPVTLYPFGRGYPRWAVRLAPGDETRTSYGRPCDLSDPRVWDGVVGRPEASDDAGRLVYCHALQLRDVEPDGRLIDLAAGGQCPDG